MNYYPNSFYQNYSYNNPYIQNNAGVMQSQTSALQGKVVDGPDMVKATEVLFGGYGIFPKADLSEIYIKNWNNNGTTQIITYKPVIEDNSVTDTGNQDILLEKIQKIEEKLDLLAAASKTVNTQSSTLLKSSDVKRKDVDLNVY